MIFEGSAKNTERTRIKLILAIGINTTRNQLRRNMIECITIRKGTARNSHIQKAGLFHSCQEITIFVISYQKTLAVRYTYP
jgi:hypothetical protein